MIETILACVITGLFSVVVVELQEYYKNKDEKQNLRIELEKLNYKFDLLEEKVTKHNNLVERVYRIEEVNARQEEQIKTLFKQGDN